MTQDVDPQQQLTQTTSHTITCQQSKWKDIVCGFGAACVSMPPTFPLNKISFRQTLYGVPLIDAYHQVKSEGLRHLYRGVLPALCQRSVAVSAMFGTFSHVQQFLDSTVPHLNKHLLITSAATAAGLAETLFTPVERVQTLLQDDRYNKKFRNTGHVFFELRKYGLGEYYRGCTSCLLRNCLTSIMFFTIQEYLCDKKPALQNRYGKFAADFTCGALTGAIVSTVCYPITVVKTHMQCTIGGPFNGCWKTARIVFDQRERSIRRMFYGVHLNYVRAVLSWGIITASYDFFMDFIK